MKAKPTKFDNMAGSIAGIILVALICGALGYLSQSGLIGGSSKRSRRRMRKQENLVTKETFERRSKAGWWIGCGIGTVFGSFMFYGPRKQKR